MNIELLWRLIIKCHNINKSVYKGTTPSKKELFLYKQKNLLLETICDQVKRQNSIKYSFSHTGGYCPFVIYFEYNNTQISFHTSSNYGITIEDAISWDGIPKGYISWKGKYPGTKGLKDQSNNKYINLIKRLLQGHR